MRELAIVAAVVLVLVGLGVVTLLGWTELLSVALYLVVLGFLVGVPTGFVYHVLLFARLRRVGKLPRGWIWRPIALNKTLSPRDKWLVLPWCYLGALGFFVIVVGLVLVVVSMGSAWVQTSPPSGDY